MPEVAQSSPLPSPDGASQPMTVLPPPARSSAVVLPPQSSAPISATDQLRNELTELSRTIRIAGQNTVNGDRRQFDAWAAEVDGYRREFEAMTRSHRGNIQELMERIHRTEQSFYNVYGTPDVKNGVVTHPTGSITVTPEAVGRSLAQSSAEPIAPGVPEGAVGVTSSELRNRLMAQLDQLGQEGSSFWSGRQGYRTRGPVFARQIENYKRSVDAIFNGTSHKNIHELVADINGYERDFRRVAGGSPIVTVTDQEVTAAMKEMVQRRAKANEDRNAANRTALTNEYHQVLGNRVLDSLGDRVALKLTGAPEGGWSVQRGNMHLLFRRDPKTMEYFYADISNGADKLEWKPVNRAIAGPEATPEIRFFSKLINDLHRIQYGPRDPSEKEGQYTFLRLRDEQAGGEHIFHQQAEQAPSKLSLRLLNELEAVQYLGENRYQVTFLPGKDPAHNTAADEAQRQAHAYRIQFMRDPGANYEMRWRFAPTGATQTEWHSTRELPFPQATSKQGVQVHVNRLIDALDLANRGGGFESYVTAAWGAKNIRITPPDVQGGEPVVDDSKARMGAALQQVASQGSKVLTLFHAQRIDPKAEAGNAVYELDNKLAAVLVKQDEKNHWVWAVKPAAGAAPQWQATDRRLEPKNGIVPSPEERNINLMLEYLDRLNVEFERGMPAELRTTP